MSATVSQVKSVYLFKNGYGLIIKQFDLPYNRTNVELVDDILPKQPTYGTFWIQSLTPD
ncbi:unnamed protein product, partial [Didymodactylos carnosus]